MLFKPEDIRVSTYSTKPQGWLARPDNGVRIIHLPTGIEVTCDSERSQFRNRTLAVSKLIEALEKGEKEKHMAKPHKHAEIIKAWADGAQIEYRYPSWEEGKWEGIPNHKTPMWDVAAEYRIKPEREYPKSTLTDKELGEMWGGGQNSPFIYLRRVADEAIKRYIQDQELSNAARAAN